MKLNKAIRSMHGFIRPESHLVYGTYHGAIVTIIGCLLASVLFISEVHQYYFTPAAHEITVDSERHALLPIGLDITFPSLPCSVMSIDMQDESGDVESDAFRSVHHMHVAKQRLTTKGKKLSHGDYKAPEPDTIIIVAGSIVQDSRQHIADMEQEMKDEEGCQIHGSIEVKRLAGNLKLSIHLKDWLLLQSTRDEIQKAYQDMQDRASKGDVAEKQVMSNFNRANVSHHITKFAVGDDYPGKINPLDKFHRIIDHNFGTFNYYLKVVPTTYVSAMWKQTHTYQYSVSEYFSPGGASAPESDANTGSTMPALTFSYDLSPLHVKIHYPQRGVGSFMVRLCAVLGGCFALTGSLDSFIHFVLRIIR